MDGAQRRGMWAGRTGRFLSADMAIKEWCMLNKVSESNLYRWMARFREEEPGRPPQIQQVSTLILLHAVFFKLRLEIGELVASVSRQFERGLRFRFCFYGLDNREHCGESSHWESVPMG